MNSKESHTAGKPSEVSKRGISEARKPRREGSKQKLHTEGRKISNLVVVLRRENCLGGILAALLSSRQ